MVRPSSSQPGTFIPSRDLVHLALPTSDTVARPSPLLLLYPIIGHMFSAFTFPTFTFAYVYATQSHLYFTSFDLIVNSMIDKYYY